jgi:hypothetical protein
MTGTLPDHICRTRRIGTTSGSNTDLLIAWNFKPGCNTGSPSRRARVLSRIRVSVVRPS